MSEHKWSGWPGAYCFKCGIEDPMEIAIGREYYDPYTRKWTDTPEAQEFKERAERSRSCPVEP